MSSLAENGGEESEKRGCLEMEQAIRALNTSVYISRALPWDNGGGVVNTTLMRMLRICDGLLKSWTSKLGTEDLDPKESDLPIVNVKANSVHEYQDRYEHACACAQACVLHLFDLYEEQILEQLKQKRFSSLNNTYFRK